MFDNLIGKNISDAPSEMPGYWPEISDDGTITAIIGGDEVPEDAVLVWWMGDHAEETDGDNGFDAVLV